MSMTPAGPRPRGPGAEACRLEIAERRMREQLCSLRVQPVSAVVACGKEVGPNHSMHAPSRAHSAASGVWLFPRKKKGKWALF